MAKVELSTPAPDFELRDYRGDTVRLSHFLGVKHVILVLNRGFA